MAKNALPTNVRLAARSFQRKRAVYYRYLASMLESSKGGTKLATIFERDAQRYEGKPLGRLAAHWSALYQANGANLADAWQGTLPDDEVSVIRVSQDAGDGALLSALKDVARIAKLSDRVKNEVLATMAAAIVGVSIALTMATIYPIFATTKLQEVYGFLPLSEWGPRGKSFNQHAANVKDYGLYFVLLLFLVISYFMWTINGLIGPVRDWLDSKVAVYKTIRDIKGALFLATRSTLTRKRGNVMFTLGESLQQLAQSARSPWSRWRLEEIANNIESAGAVGSTAFKTNMLSEEMYYYLRDTQEARGFSEGFDETGKYVEENVVEQIVRNMTIYRWILLLTGVVVVVSIIGWQFAVIYEMKGVMLNYYSSR